MRIKIYLGTIIFIVTFFVAISACQPRTSDCPPDSVTYLANPSGGNELSQIGPLMVEIRGKESEVDRVVHGSFCDDTWDGKVYVACDLEIPAWDDAPTFLEDCSLTVEPGTVVYVAAHNDEAFYKGCSCHTGEEPDY